MGDRTLFFYGTLMSPQVLYRVIYGTHNATPLEHPAMQHLTFRPALLHAHRRHRVAGADYPAVIPTPKTPTSCVRGTLVTNLTEGDVYRLDIFEGDAYTRQEIIVEVLEDVALDEAAPLPSPSSISKHDDQQQTPGAKTAKTAKAQTYIWTAPATELEAQEWDFEDFKKHKMRAWMGLPSSPEDSNPNSFHPSDSSSSYQTNDGHNSRQVEVDDGFADVDRAVAAMQKDPTGGRGVNGHIGRALAAAQRGDA
jgi:hypothetical protein